MKFTEENDIIFIVGGALIEGVLNPLECGGFKEFGVEGKKSLVLLTQSDGSSIINEMIENVIIEDRNLIFLLDDLNDSEVEETKYGFKIKKAIYLSEEEYEHHLGLLDKKDIYYNLSYYKEINF